MGLTKSSVGASAIDRGFGIKRQSDNDKIIALAGNPNVGKSTVFNGLTGMNQHTGNWPGKTVSNAYGYHRTERESYVFVDIPGTYSLMAHSSEEEVARNFICFGGADAVVVVCDATCLERNLNLVLQTMEISKNVVVCVNLMDEAKRKHISIDCCLISERLGVPVVPIVARKKESLEDLVAVLSKALEGERTDGVTGVPVKYPCAVERAISVVEARLASLCGDKICSRFLSLRLLEKDESFLKEIALHLGDGCLRDSELLAALARADKMLSDVGITHESLKDVIVTSLIRRAEAVCKGAITYECAEYNSLDRKVDRVLTSKLLGFPVMGLLLAFIFWLTITGANYPSKLLSELLFSLQDKLTAVFFTVGAPDWLHGVLVLGVYRVLAWVVSVMLPPMAIFFPLFTLLEDVGYMPRIAYNLDKPFKKCKSCGKQALTMCMGFGCNTAGVVGCRIIDSPRERLLAILTNNFVPCNGRFPTLIAIITMFFIGSSSNTIISALMLTALILLGVFMTFLVTRLLSGTLLRGVPSSYTLELPSYRKPQIGKVIVRSIFDRTLFVLGRAVSVAAPAGAVIWLLANVDISGSSLLSICADFLNPIGSFFGLDGVILLAFILGFPANEIVIPIIIMAYMAEGSIVSLDSLEQMRQLFLDNGWTQTTAVCTMLFSLMHWPCSTTLLTIKKETGSLKWTAAAAVIPTLLGMLACSLVKLFDFIL